MDGWQTNTKENCIRMFVVTNAVQLSHALAIRSICAFEESGLTFAQAFDGNDFQATHIVAYADEEPIGATRIRWFKDFAKIERTGFRKAYRSARILKQCSDFIFNHVAQKGYSQLITHAEPKYALVWKKILGFREVEGRPAVKTGAHEPYLELVKELTVPPDAISPSSEPKMFFRTEGFWHVPSAFE